MASKNNTKALWVNEHTHKLIKLESVRESMNINDYIKALVEKRNSTIKPGACPRCGKLVE
jgi:hypothetical protein